MPYGSAEFADLGIWRNSGKGHFGTFRHFWGEGLIEKGHHITKSYEHITKKYGKPIDTLTNLLYTPRI